MLENPIGIVFEDIHMANILDFISNNYDINVVLDERAVAPAKYSPENYGYFYAEPKGLCQSCTPQTDGMIRYINIKKISIQEVLDVLCRQLELVYRMVEGRVILGAADKLDEGVPDEFLWSPDRFDEPIKQLRLQSSPKDEPDPIGKVTEESKRLSLSQIVDDKNGKYMARISTSRGRARFYEVGDKFEEYEVISIDPDSGCCTILSEVNSETFTLCVE
jgi:hypothetical protein